MGKYQREINFPGKSSDEIYEKISTTIEQFLDKLSLSNVNLERSPGKKSVSFKSKVASAKLTCHEEKILIEAELGFMAMAFKSKIDQGIDKWLSQALDSKARPKE